MADNLHPVVSLLIARMESHPDEFIPYRGRWDDYVTSILQEATGANLDTFKAALSKVRLDALHHQVMDELLNGEERRAELERRKQEEMQKVRAQMMGVASIQAQYPQASLQNALSNTVNEAMRIHPHGELELGGEKLDANILRQIKKKLGI